MNDKLREAALLALDALDSDDPTIQMRAALNLRAALAEQEPEQEPVAWTTMPEAEDWCFVSSSKDPTGKLEGKWFPLYTAPPRREWVGLTDEEIDAIYLQHHNQYDECELPNWSYERAIEAKLREKNGG